MPPPRTGPKLEMLGKVFGRLVVLKFNGRIYCGKQSHFEWLCQCICGNQVSVEGYNLRSGKSKSCGCLCIERTIQASTTHGFSSGTVLQRRFRDIWSSMRQRCSNPSQDYGGCYLKRGIRVCDRWQKFENFRDDLWNEYKERGEKGEKISIDRIDVDGNYEPSNCRWATVTQQVNNRRCSTHSEDFKQHKYWENRLRESLRVVLRENLRCGYRENSQSFQRDYGCTVTAFKKHIEEQLQPGMTWGNWRPYRKLDPNVWNMDHIIPIYKFDLSREADRKKCFYYTNYRPMWALENHATLIR